VDEYLFSTASALSGESTAPTAPGKKEGAMAKKKVYSAIVIAQLPRNGKAVALGELRKKTGLDKKSFSLPLCRT